MILLINNTFVPFFLNIKRLLKPNDQYNIFQGIKSNSPQPLCTGYFYGCPHLMSLTSIWSIAPGSLAVVISVSALSKTWSGTFLRVAFWTRRVVRYRGSWPMLPARWECCTHCRSTDRRGTLKPWSPYWQRNSTQRVTQSTALLNWRTKHLIGFLPV